MKQNHPFSSLISQKSLILLLLISLNTITTFAQKAIIKGKVDNFKDAAFRIVIPNRYFDQDNKKSIFNTKIDTLGNFYQEVNLSNPEIVYLQYYNTTSKKSLLYNLFVAPGDELSITIDNTLKPENVKVKGKHQENNQFLNISTHIDLQKFKGDTLPDNVYKEIQQIALNNKLQLEKYIKEHKPSKEFIKYWQTNLEYIAPETYYSFEHNNKFTNRNAYKRNIDKWKAKRNELFSKIKINNDEALNAPNYQNLVGDILLRTKEELLEEASGENKKNFFKEWYNTSIEEGDKLFRDDMTNILTEKIIQKYYTGKSAEFAYVLLLNKSIKKENNKNLPQIFENFKKQFPNSSYISDLQPKIDIIIEKNNKPLTDKMIFVKNGEQFNSFEEVINQFKGKTVLIDMWGTWCDPCRQEIAQHSETLHEYFKDKDVQFLYIANFDIHNPENWKKIIAYQSIEGFHILANYKLTNDIMTKSKGTGYPTYIIIKKDGSYELSKAGYPMNRETITKQLEAAISM
ncbi:TlpA family protein disulfide reductase [Flavobacterium sp. MAHUQ-51]|uniref:TlpA family protein disulfide reductase n=1 Tax=Flavobacterium sp. GCM10022190 TaxID=3252639 RepID=UPI003611BE18